MYFVCAPGELRTIQELQADISSAELLGGKQQNVSLSHQNSFRMSVVYSNRCCVVTSAQGSKLPFSAHIVACYIDQG